MLSRLLNESESGPDLAARAARWADAEGGGFRWDSHPAYTQSENEVTVTNASKTLGVRERGIYHAKNVLFDAAERLPRAPHDQGSKSDGRGEDLPGPGEGWAGEEKVR